MTQLLHGLALLALAVDVTVPWKIVTGPNVEESVPLTIVATSSTGVVYAAAHIYGESVAREACSRVEIGSPGSRGMLILKFRAGAEKPECLYFGAPPGEYVYPTSLRAGLDGAIYVRGFATDSSFFTVSPEMRFPPDDRFLAKLEPNRTTFTFVRQMPANLFDSDIAVSSAGAIWFGGFTRLGLDFRAVVGRLSGETGAPEFSVILGDQRRDSVRALTFDADGKVYAVGSRIWKFSPSGQLLWSTVLQPWYGADYGYMPNAAATGPDGSLYWTGCTSQGFYTTPGVVQEQPIPIQTFLHPFESGSQCYDALIVRLSSDGRLIFATYWGGRGNDNIHFIDVDSEGWATVLGYAALPGFPTREITAVPGRKEGRLFAARISPDGRTLDYSTYLGHAVPLVAPPGSATRDRSGGFYQAGFQPFPEFNQYSILRIAGGPSRFPRLDSVSVAGSLETDPFPGATLTIEGESFSPDTRVWIGDRELTPEAGITDRQLHVTIPLDTSLGSSVLHVESTNPATGERSRSASVRIVIEATPKP